MNQTFCYELPYLVFRLLSLSFKVPGLRIRIVEVVIVKLVYCCQAQELYELVGQALFRTTVGLVNLGYVVVTVMLNRTSCIIS